MNTIESTIEEIFSLYALHGNEDYIGEPVSQIEHMSQAAQLAIMEGYDEQVILAAFFHDIGHICVKRDHINDMAGLGTINHEEIGAAYLRKKGFPEKIAKLVGNHVKAKRYLTYKYPTYYNGLSDASRRTLEFQGGKMTSEEAKEFEEDPLFAESIALRKWDELAKNVNTPLLDMDVLKGLARKVLKEQKLS